MILRYDEGEPYSKFFSSQERNRAPSLFFLLPSRAPILPRFAMPPPSWIVPQLTKYTELLRLRRGDLDGSIRDPRPALIALSREFPGSLREIDRLPMKVLEHREAYLQCLLVQPQHPQPYELWAPLGMRHHELLRGALELKRWLAKRHPTFVLQLQLKEEFCDLYWQRDALAWRSSLEQIAAPPQGRLVQLVLERLSQESGYSPEVLRSILFSTT